MHMEMWKSISFGMCMSDSGAVGKTEYVNALKSISTFVDVVS